MSPWGGHLPLVLFIYGLAYFAMGLAIVLEARPGSKLPLARNLWPLAAFGFLHGAVEWLDMAALLRSQPSPLLGNIPLPSARMGLLVASTLALAWFGAALLAEEDGRWRLSRWIPPALLLAWLGAAFAVPGLGLVAAEDRTAWAGIWARYLLYLPGCALSALALARQAPALHGLGFPRIAGDCRRAAAAFGLNAFIAGLVVPRAGFFPASFLNYQSFSATVGLPPQVFRGAAALAIAYFVVRVLRLFELQLRLERERFASRALLAQEEERKRIARELHDETAQLLSSLLVRISLLDPTRSPAEVGKARAELVALATRAVEGVRRLALELRPPELDDLGLEEAIRWYVDDFSARSGVAARLQPASPVGRLAPTAELALYRITQEALTNVARHAAAKQARVTLDRRDGMVLLSVEDDGRGFDVSAALAAKERGMGLFGMQERAALLGGRLRLQSEPGRGTRVEAEIPIPALGEWR